MPRNSTNTSSSHDFHPAAHDFGNPPTAARTNQRFFWMPPATSLADQSSNDTQSTTLGDTIDRTRPAGLDRRDAVASQTVFQMPYADMDGDEDVSALSLASGAIKTLNGDDAEHAQPTSALSRARSKRNGNVLQKNAVIGACDDSENAGMLQDIIRKRNHAWGKLGAESNTMLAKVNLRILKRGDARTSHPVSAEEAHEMVKERLFGRTTKSTQSRGEWYGAYSPSKRSEEIVIPMFTQRSENRIICGLGFTAYLDNASREQLSNKPTTGPVNAKYNKFFHLWRLTSQSPSNRGTIKAMRNRLVVALTRDPMLLDKERGESAELLTSLRVKLRDGTYGLEPNDDWIDKSIRPKATTWLSNSDFKTWRLIGTYESPPGPVGTSAASDDNAPDDEGGSAASEMEIDPPVPVPKRHKNSSRGTRRSGTGASSSASRDKNTDRDRGKSNGNDKRNGKAIAPASKAGKLPTIPSRTSDFESGSEYMEEEASDAETDLGQVEAPRRGTRAAVRPDVKSSSSEGPATSNNSGGPSAGLHEQPHGHIMARDRIIDLTEVEDVSSSYDSSEEEDDEMGVLEKEDHGMADSEADVPMQDIVDQKDDLEEPNPRAADSEGSDEDTDEVDSQFKSGLTALTRSNTLQNSGLSTRRQSAIDGQMDEDDCADPESGIVRAGPSNALVAGSWREMQERQMSQIEQRRAWSSNGLTQIWDIENDFRWKEPPYNSNKSTGATRDVAYDMAADPK